MNRFFTCIFFLLAFSAGAQVQTGTLKGFVKSGQTPLEFVNIGIKNTALGSSSNEQGYFEINNLPFGTYEVLASFIGYDKQSMVITLNTRQSTQELNFNLPESSSTLGEVVISGTMKEVSKQESPVPIETYSAKFFYRNPVPSIFDALQNVNGVRPQLNCNVCNTGDIHINGLEGPYTMVLIDGMPIVSGLSTVYGLNGIPSALIDRVEVVKGPASTLYGSEAVGGLINVITKSPSNAPLLSADVFATSWGEVNSDLGFKFNLGEKAQSLVGINYFNFNQRIDNNDDNFTDITLQSRLSLFNKWNFKRNDNRVFSLAGRYIYEDRWGGDMRWAPEFRGGDEIYGESIFTERWEFMSAYQLPVKDKVLLQVSANGHDQNSVYGNTPYLGKQYIGFGQMTWNKQLGLRHDLLIGTALRYTFYDDNTPATASFDTLEPQVNRPSKTLLPGLFIQDEINLHPNHKLLLGMRYDYNSIHGSIFTPRFNYKWASANRLNTLRVGMGNGYRIANVFTEDHAALTGARQVKFLSDLKPETSWNANVNFVKKFFTKTNAVIGLDATAFYTYFNNKIFADYDSDPNLIVYDNLDGHAISKGISLNLDLSFKSGFKLNAGGTLMDVSNVEQGISAQQILTERFSGVWSVSYTVPKLNLTFDYTGNLYGPMRLPLLGELDPRPEFSPWWSIQNIQVLKSFKNGLEIYGGVKNLLNWVPGKDGTFLIARANDPFDKQVQFGANGQVIPTPDNPYALTFDPTYMYAPNQGIRGFFGIRYLIKG
jgi:outer membrane receptor for ferrienterochelin and colicins